MKYRKKPVVIEAIQWTGANLEEIKTFVGESLVYDICDTAWEVGIRTLEGMHECTEGDFIIKGIKGEFYPCKPDIFEQTYESVDEDNSEVSKIVKDLDSTARWFENHGRNTNNVVVDICRDTIDFINRQQANINKLAASVLDKE